MSKLQRLGVTSLAAGVGLVTFFNAVAFVKAQQSPRSPVPAPTGFIVGEIRQFSFDTKSPAYQALEQAGWLECDGRSLAITAYGPLHQVIGQRYGSKSQNDSFNLPDYRGVFLRGWTNGRNVKGNAMDPDAIRRVGPFLEANKAKGELPGTTGDTVGSFEDASLGRHSHGLDGQFTGTSDNPPTGSALGYGGSNRGRVTAEAGGSETRPTNMTVLYCIYTGVPKSAN